MGILKNNGWNFTKFDFLKWIYRSKELNVSHVGWTWRDPHPHTSLNQRKNQREQENHNRNKNKMIHHIRREQQCN